MSRQWIVSLGAALLLFFLCPLARAQEESEDNASWENPTGCPVHCNQFEACVGNRCVEMCRSGCRDGTYCTPAGECEQIPEPSRPVLTEEDRQRLSGAPSAESRVLTFADIGGVVGYGVRAGFEYGESHSLISRVQFLNTGIMSHAVYPENEFQRFDWGFGTSIGYRNYGATWGNLRGFYFGGGLDYTVIRMSDRLSENEFDIIHTVAPFGEFGYRWVFKTWAFGFGPTLSLRYPIATGFSLQSRSSCGPDEDCAQVTSRRFEGTLHIEVGWYQ